MGADQHRPSEPLIEPPVGFRPTGPSPPNNANNPSQPTLAEYSQGVLILVLGIMSLVVCMIGPVVLILRFAAFREKAKQPNAKFANTWRVNVGALLGVISTCVFVWLVVYVKQHPKFLGE
jgi:cobalamin biosynthesis protein CobD/CbiB